MTYQVQFRKGSPVTVTPVIYFKEEQEVAYASTPNGPGWPSLIEKAYAIWKGRNSYQRLNFSTGKSEVPGAQTVLGDLIGPSDMADIKGQRFFPHNGNIPVPILTNEHLKEMARGATRRPTIAASRKQNTQNGIESDHGYAVLRFQNDRVVLRNPWGGAGAERTLTIAQLRTNFRAIFQAH